MKPVRNSAKALIVRDGKLLCTKNTDKYGVFYLLPGGGMEPGETLDAALKRECMEEIGCEVEVGELRLLREYIGKNHEFAEEDFDIHQLEFMFICSLKEGFELHNGCNPDSYQIGVEWLDIERFEEYRFYPAELKKVLAADGSISGPVYMGDTY